VCIGLGFDFRTSTNCWCVRIFVSGWGVYLYITGASTNPHWARVVGYSPFSLCVIHKEGPSIISGDINRLMMMMMMMTGASWHVNAHAHTPLTLIPRGSRDIPKESSQIFLRDVLILPKLFSYDHYPYIYYRNEPLLWFVNIMFKKNTYIPLALYPRRYSRGISDIPLRQPRLTKMTQLWGILHKWQVVNPSPSDRSLSQV
jgi:hypothetical protein